jgi:allantoin racemase
MKMGFMHVSPAVENSPEAEIIKAWDRCIRKTTDLFKADGTEVTFLIARGGINPDAGNYRYINVLMEIEYLYGYMELEKAGCDAVSVVCFGDQMLHEARQALDIPFIAPSDVSMRMATMMGTRVGLICPPGVPISAIEGKFHQFGLQEQAVPVRNLQVSFNELMNAVTDGHVLIEAFIEASKKLIADGAEVIVPSCMGVDPVLSAAPGCEKEYPNGLKEVDGVPIMNVVAHVIKVAEAIVAMKKAGVPWISRKGSYSSVKSNKKAMEAAAPLLEYTGPGFWFD